MGPKSLLFFLIYVNDQTTMHKNPTFLRAGDVQTDTCIDTEDLRHGNELVRTLGITTE